jgi:hypothetical protein
MGIRPLPSDKASAYSLGNLARARMDYLEPLLIGDQAGALR